MLGLDAEVQPGAAIVFSLKIHILFSDTSWIKLDVFVQVISQEADYQQ